MTSSAATLLLRDADCVATFDDACLDLRRASVLVRGGLIEAVGAAADLPQEADEVIDARGHVVVPGLVNTHHMFQSLTRAIPAVQNAELFSWLRGLYPIWAGLTPEMVRVSTQVAMAELLLSGCTTSCDQLYVYPNGVRLDDSIEAAQQIGMRFVASRGSMSVGESQGGLPPDALVEREDAILRDTERVIGAFHDASHGSMVNVAVPPCSPFSVSRELMRESAALARARSNMRLASGIAPVRRMLDAGVPVGLGVDGSASNDDAHLLAEARQATLLARVGRSLEPFGRDHDIGRIAPGMCADLAVFDVRGIAVAGAAVHDPVASVVFCAGASAAWTIVDGRVVVREGRLATLEIEPLLERHDRLAREIAAGR